jgi:hypothetical protein
VGYRHSDPDDTVADGQSLRNLYLCQGGLHAAVHIRHSRAGPRNPAETRGPSLNRLRKNSNRLSRLPSWDRRGARRAGWSGTNHVDSEATTPALRATPLEEVAVSDRFETIGIWPLPLAFGIENSIMGAPILGGECQPRKNVFSPFGRGLRRRIICTHLIAGAPDVDDCVDAVSGCG